jgi:hypothetical protein
MTNVPDWHLSGDFLELCNCRVGCPCLLIGQTVAPTEGTCDGGFVWHIEQGHFGGVEVDGLNFAFIHSAPGIMAEGNWTTAAYVDERASPPQRDALATIVCGQAGGPLQAFMALSGRFLGLKYVPIEYHVDGGMPTASIPRILDFAVEGMQKAAFSEPIRLQNTRPWVPWMALAKGVRGTYQDYGLHFEDTGRNGHFGPFQWPRV